MKESQNIVRNVENWVIIYLIVEWWKEGMLLTEKMIITIPRTTLKKWKRKDWKMVWKMICNKMVLMAERRKHNKIKLFLLRIKNNLRSITVKIFKRIGAEMVKKEKKNKKKKMPKKKNIVIFKPVIAKKLIKRQQRKTSKFKQDKVDIKGAEHTENSSEQNLKEDTDQNHNNQNNLNIQSQKATDETSEIRDNRKNQDDEMSNIQNEQNTEEKTESNTVQQNKEIEHHANSLPSATKNMEVIELFVDLNCDQEVQSKNLEVSKEIQQNIQHNEASQESNTQKTNNSQDQSKNESMSKGGRSKTKSKEKKLHRYKNYSEDNMGYDEKQGSPSNQDAHDRRGRSINRKEVRNNKDKTTSSHHWRNSKQSSPSPSFQ